MRLEIYCEAAPLSDEYFGQGLLRALVPILTAVDAEIERFYCFPTQRRISPAMVVAKFRDRTRIANPIFAKIVSKLDGIAPRLSALVFALFCKLAFGRTHGATHVFAVIGANYHALLRARSFARTRGLPLILYLVDDLIEPVRIAGGQVDTGALAQVRDAIGSATGVFCISDALAERVREDTGVAAIGLELPYVEHPTVPEAEEKPQLIFIGSVNFLYASALRRVIDAVDGHNAGAQQPVSIVITSNRDAVLREIGDVPDFVRFESYASRDDLLGAIAASRAAIVPYSAEPQHRPMVESSFPSKMLDYLEAARDILLVAPAYSSAARYFEGVAGMEPLASSEDIVARVTARPDPALRPVLRQLLRERHSTARFRDVIAASATGGPAA